jgi:hypothetical protein
MQSNVKPHFGMLIVFIWFSRDGLLLTLLCLKSMRVIKFIKELLLVPHLSLFNIQRDTKLAILMTIKNETNLQHFNVKEMFTINMELLVTVSLNLKIIRKYGEIEGFYCY